MYAEHFGFTGLPFHLTPDSRFYFGSSGHSRASAHLVYGLAQEEGFVVITGEVGAGKTTLVEQLWSQLDRATYVIARVVTTQVSGDDLLRLVATGFGVSTDGDKAQILRRLEQAFRANRDAGRRSLLVVDEVQSLSIAALEELRMLSNLTTDGRASLQTILLGQPQFRRTLASPDLDQLRQRVLASYHLGPLTEDETRAYIQHRLRMVGWAGPEGGRPSWTGGAFATVHRRTGGIPRRINTLCSRVLLYCALEDAETVTAEMVEQTAAELDHDLGAGLSTGLNGTGLNGALGHHGAGAGVTTPMGQNGTAELYRRVDALEQTTARQDRIFRRLLELLGTVMEVPR
jgi:general secretion pathway protein A